MRRLALAALTAVLAGAALSGTGATPAHAAPASDLAGVRAILTGCTGTTASPTTVELTADITQPAEELVIPCSVVLDLGEHALSLRRISVAPSTRLTIRSTGAATGELVVATTEVDEAAISIESAQFHVESGTVTASSRFFGAGIGGDALASGGSVNISGGSVEARGGTGGAGIGSGMCGGGGNGYVQTGGTVLAVAGDAGSGIGGGYASLGSQVFIHGGVLEARGRTSGSAIGSGLFATAGYACTPIPWPAGPGSVLITAGTVTASARVDAAGIGATYQEVGPDITIEGGTVSVTTENETALGGPGSDISITGGTVTAAATESGSGVGGDAGTLSVTGGTLTASSDRGVAIGSRYRPAEVGMDVTIGAGAAVNVTGAATAFGGIAGFGSLSVDGDLRLASAPLQIPAGTTVEIGATGRLLGIAGSELSGGTVSGSGRIDNGGVISLDAALVTSVVDDRDYLVTFDGVTVTAVRLFGPDFATGFRTVPAPSPGTRWNTAPDGSGTDFTASTAVTADAILYEALSVASVELTPVSSTTTAGVAVTFTATVRDAQGDPVSPAPSVVLTSSEPGDTVTGLTVSGTAAGVRTITAEAIVGGATVATDTAQLTVVAAAPASLDLRAPATSVRQGGSLTFIVTAEDAYGNPASTAGVVITSDVATDVVSGLTVSFPHASPHRITATTGQLSASVVVQVLPAAGLGLTGSDPAAAVLAAVALLAAGGGILLLRSSRGIGAPARR